MHNVSLFAICIFKIYDSCSTQQSNLLMLTGMRVVGFSSTISLFLVFVVFLAALTIAHGGDLFKGPAVGFPS